MEILFKWSKWDFSCAIGRNSELFGSCSIRAFSDFQIGSKFEGALEFKVMRDVLDDI